MMPCLSLIPLPSVLEEVALTTKSETVLVKRCPAITQDILAK
jgi:hypothetical protein